MVFSLIVSYGICLWTRGPTSHGLGMQETILAITGYLCLWSAIT